MTASEQKRHLHRSPAEEKATGIPLISDSADLGGTSPDGLAPPKPPSPSSGLAPSTLHLATPPPSPPPAKRDERTFAFTRVRRKGGGIIVTMLNYAQACPRICPRASHFDRCVRCFLQDASGPRASSVPRRAIATPPSQNANQKVYAFTGVQGGILKPHVSCSVAALRTYQLNSQLTLGRAHDRSMGEGPAAAATSPRRLQSQARTVGRSN